MDVQLGVWIIVTMGNLIYAAHQAFGMSLPSQYTSVPGSSSFKLCNISGPCHLRNNMAEEEKSLRHSDHSFPTGLCLWDLFTEPVLVAKTEVSEKRAARSKEADQGKAQMEKHRLGFICIILCQLCILLLLELLRSTCLKIPTTHFCSHKTLCLLLLPSKYHTFKIGLFLNSERCLSANRY